MLAERLQIAAQVIENRRLQRAEKTQLVPQFPRPLVQLLKSLRAPFFLRAFKGTLPAAIRLAHPPANLFAGELVQAPLCDRRLRPVQRAGRLILPPGERGQKTIQFEREQFLRFREASAARGIRTFAQLLHRLQPHFGIADIGNQAPDVAQTAILTPKAMMAYLRRQETQGSARLLQMLQRLMNLRSLAVARQFARGGYRRLDFLASDLSNRLSEGPTYVDLVFHRSAAPTPAPSSHYCNATCR